MMKDGVVFVNTARGKIVDEEALYKALKTGKVFSAGLDTMRVEPFDASQKLFSLPNVVITPHMAWNTEETDYRLSAQVVEIVEAFVQAMPIHIIPEQQNQTEKRD